MKLLVLSHISELLGGAERSILDIMDNWSEKYDVEVEFILREPIKSLAGEIQKRGWKYHALKYTFWSWPTLPSRPEDIFRESVQNSQAIKEIEELIKQIKPDAVVTNTIICPWAALAAHYQKVPHIWVVREYGDLDHGRQFEISQQATFEDVGNLSNLVVANSNTLARHIEQYVDKSKVTFLYNPFDVDDLDKRAKQKVPNPYKHSDSLKLIMTSNIARTKGQAELVEAVGVLNQQGKNTELCLVGRSGDADFSHELEEIINQYKIGDKVHMVGLKPDAIPYVALADVGIIASRKEAFGRTTFEYLLLGKSVVGADSGATPELVGTDGKCGFLYEPGDVKSLVAAIARYVDDNTLAAKHGKAARERGISLLSGAHNSDSLFAKVKAVTQGKGHAKASPINFTHRWLDYQENADKFIKQSGDTSLYRTARLRLRQKAKGAYHRSRTLKARITGK